MTAVDGAAPRAREGSGVAASIVRVLQRWPVHLTLLIIGLLWFLPTAALLVSSFRPSNEVLTTGWWTAFSLPFDFTLKNYQDVLGQNRMAGSFINSLFITIPAVLISIMIAAFAAFAFAGFTVALRCRDPFGKLLAAGLTALICGQAAINLAAVLGIAPLTGIPLPFVSYGGSSLVVLLAGVGILLNIAVNGRVAKASVRDRGGRDRRSRSAGARDRRGAARTRSERDVRRVPRPRRVAARS